MSQNVLLKLSTEDEAAGNRLKLEQAVILSEVRTVTSNTETKELTFTFGEEAAPTTLYFTLSDRLDELLELVNPLQMVSRRVNRCEALHQTNEQLVKDYGYLVEYYSVRDEQKSKAYLDKLKQAIQKMYAMKPINEAGVKHEEPAHKKLDTKPVEKKE